MGRPIVAFAHGGAVESIEHEKTGWLATPGDADSLAENLRAALSLQPRARKAYAHNARAYRSAFFNRSNVSETLKIYRRMLAKTKEQSGAIIGHGGSWSLPRGALWLEFSAVSDYFRCDLRAVSILPRLMRCPFTHELKKVNRYNAKYHASRWVGSII